MDATDRATAALFQAIYFLDRELAPSNKVRAFSRAIDTIAELETAELDALVSADQVTSLDGIGASTGSVITAAVRDEPNTYLAKLADRSTVPIGEGVDIRNALRGDLHSHSTWSDGGAPLPVMARTAQALGHDYLVATDHSPRLTIAHGLSEERLANQQVEIAALNDELAPFQILSGIEVDILVDGTLDLPDSVLEQLDVVVASVHSKLRLPRDEMTKRMVLALASPHTDILGHMTNRKVVGTGRAPSDFDPEVVFAAAARFDKAIEINCRPERQDPPEELLAMAIEWGCKIAINTDAHAPGQLEWQNYGCDKAAALGVDPDDIINTWSAEELLSWTAAHPR